MRSPITSITRQVREKCDCLNCFAQTHLIGENPIHLVVIQTNEPLHTNLLVWSQSPTKKKRKTHFAGRVRGHVIFAVEKHVQRCMGIGGR